MCWLVMRLHIKLSRTVATFINSLWDDFPNKNRVAICQHLLVRHEMETNHQLRWNTDPSIRTGEETSEHKIESPQIFQWKRNSTVSPQKEKWCSHFIGTKKGQLWNITWNRWGKWWVRGLLLNRKLFLMESGKLLERWKARWLCCEIISLELFYCFCQKLILFTFWLAVVLFYHNLRYVAFISDVSHN